MTCDSLDAGARWLQAQDLSEVLSTRGATWGGGLRTFDVLTSEGLG
jgi:hypothetical protein